MKGLEEFFDKYDFGEIFNTKPKKLVESHMGSNYKKVYYFLQYLREFFMIVYIILAIIWLFNRKDILIYLIIPGIICAYVLAVITQQMRKFIVKKYNL